MTTKMHSFLVIVMHKWAEIGFFLLETLRPPRPCVDHIQLNHNPIRIVMMQGVEALVSPYLCVRNKCDAVIGYPWLHSPL